MTRESLIALLPMGELVAAIRANGPDLLKGWLPGGVQDLKEPMVRYARQSHLVIKSELVDHNLVTWAYQLEFGKKSSAPGTDTTRSLSSRCGVGGLRPPPSP